MGMLKLNKTYLFCLQTAGRRVCHRGQAQTTCTISRQVVSEWRPV